MGPYRGATLDIRSVSSPLATRRDTLPRLTVPSGVKPLNRIPDKSCCACCSDVMLLPTVCTGVDLTSVLGIRHKCKTGELTRELRKKTCVRRL